MKQKVKLICHTWQSSTYEPELKIGGIYTIKEYEKPFRNRISIIEGAHNHYGGWWYDLCDFVIRPGDLNKNIRIL